MKSLILKRLCENSGMFGVLMHNSEIVCYTLERPWKANKPFKSCIPEGEYICRKNENVSVSTGNYDYTFEVMNVPERYGILFHIGNTINDSAGCILPGLLTGKLRDKPAVLDSRIAFERFVSLILDDEIFHLKIEDVK